MTSFKYSLRVSPSDKSSVYSVYTVMPYTSSKRGNNEFRPPLKNNFDFGPLLHTPELIISSPSLISMQSYTFLPNY